MNIQIISSAVVRCCFDYNLHIFLKIRKSLLRPHWPQQLQKTTLPLQSPRRPTMHLRPDLARHLSLLRQKEKSTSTNTPILRRGACGPLRVPQDYLHPIRRYYKVSGHNISGFTQFIFCRSKITAVLALIPCIS